MPIRDTIQTNTVPLGELFSNGRAFAVPRFQRNYSWGQQEWEDLWQDLLQAERNGREHYLGAVVLQAREDRKTYDVIDGQQRLATLSILALALIGLFEEWADAGLDAEANRERADLFRERLVSPRDPRSLKRASRLRLNQTDDPFYQSALVNGTPPASVRRLQSSEKALWDASQFFAAEVRGRFAERRDGAELAGFLDEVFSQHVIFIEIVVDDEAAAYTVFETLNARGVALGTADLLKNYLFAMAADGGNADLEEMQRLWDRLVSTVSLRSVSDLVHHFENAHALRVSKRNLFRTVRHRVTSKFEAFAYIQRLLEAAEWYAALLDPHDELWRDFPGVRRWVRVLHMLRVSQFRPLALAAAPFFSRDANQLERLFRLFVVVSVRANVVLGLNTGDLYKAWNDAAVAFSAGRLRTLADLRRAIADIYPEDDAFKAAFADLTLPARGRRKKLVRYLLATIDNDMSGGALDWETSVFTIEHVLPERIGEAWSHVDDREHKRFIDRIGNYVLLEPGLNRDLGNASFEAKREAYQTSAFATPRSVNAQQWNGEAIAAQGKRYAKRAAHLWRLD